MAVDAKIVREMADLARLTVPDERIDDLANEMTTILGFMGSIAEWDGDQSSTRPPSVRREDHPSETSSDELMTAAASLSGNAVCVPPVKDAS